MAEIELGAVEGNARLGISNYLVLDGSDLGNGTLGINPRMAEIKEGAVEGNHRLGIIRAMALDGSDLGITPLGIRDVVAEIKFLLFTPPTASRSSPPQHAS